MLTIWSLTEKQVPTEDKPPKEEPTQEKKLPDRHVPQDNVTALIASLTSKDISPEELDQALPRAAELVGTLPHGDPNTPKLLGALGQAHFIRWSVDKQQADLDATISFLSSSLTLPPIAHSTHTTLAKACAYRYSKTKDAGDLQLILDSLEAATSSWPFSEPGQDLACVHLGQAYIEQNSANGDRESLSRAFKAYRKALGLRPQGHPQRGDVAGHIALLYFNLLDGNPEEEEKIDDLDFALPICQEALEAADMQSPRRIKITIALSALHCQRFQRRQRRKDLEEGVRLALQAQDECSSDHPDLEATRKCVAKALALQECVAQMMPERQTPLTFREVLARVSPRSGAQTDRECEEQMLESISAEECPGLLLDAQISSLADQENGNLSPGAYAHLTAVLLILKQRRYERFGYRVDLDDVIRHLWTYISGSFIDPADRPCYLHHVAGRHFARSMLPEEPVADDLEKAITSWQEASWMWPEGGTGLEEVYVGLGRAFFARNRHEEGVDDLTAAIDAYEEALKLLPPDSQHRPVAIGYLHDAIHSRAERDGMPVPDRPAFVELDKDRLKALDGVVDREKLPKPEFISASFCRVIHSPASTAEDLDLAIRQGAIIETLFQDEDAAFGTFLRARAYGYIQRWNRTHEPTDIDAAIQDLTLALPMEGSEPHVGSNALGCAFRDRWQHAKNADDLDTAIGHWQMALQCWPDEVLGKDELLVTLASSLKTKYKRDKKPDTLRELIDTCEQAIQFHPAGHPQHESTVSLLAEALEIQLESEPEPNLENLERAVTLREQVLNSTSPDSATRVERTLTAMFVLNWRFRLRNDQTDLDRAISLGQEVVTTSPKDHTLRPILLHNLSALLKSRLKQSADPQDREAIVALGREIFTALPKEDSKRIGHLATTGEILFRQWKQDKNQQDLDDAITFLQEGVATSVGGHPARPMLLRNLREALDARYKERHMEMDLVNLRALRIDTMSGGVTATAAGSESEESLLPHESVSG